MPATPMNQGYGGYVKPSYGQYQQPQYHHAPQQYYGAIPPVSYNLYSQEGKYVVQDTTSAAPAPIPVN